jgi:hypothetical protein
MANANVNAEADYYTNLLFEVLSKLNHQMPVAFYPGYNSMCLDFSKFESAKCYIIIIIIKPNHLCIFIFFRLWKIK